MRSRRLFCSVALAVSCFLVLAGTAAADSIWSPVASGTGQAISAIATPKAGEVIYTTTAGEIHYLTAGGTFAKATLSEPMPLAFEDVAMSPAGNIGIAVAKGAGSTARPTRGSAGRCSPA